MTTERLSRTRASRAVAAAASLAAASALVGCTGGHVQAHASSPSAIKSSASPTRTATPSGLALRPVPYADWQVNDAGRQHDVEGFADAAGVLPGSAVRLYISTVAPAYRVTAFRMGYYAGADLAAEVWRSGPLRGHFQPAPVIDAATNTARAAWSPSVVVTTTGWPPGEYLFLITTNTGLQRYIPLTVRSPSTAGRVVIVSSVTTWQAYNDWGGYSLYHGGNDGFRDRARAVSFDRPYAEGDGAADFRGNELPLIALAERLRLPLAYETDLDLHAVPHLLDGARAVVSLGHDEYYSPRMRAALTAARDAGTNIAFLGANAVYRRIRLAPTAIGPNRLEIDYKIASEDPLDGKDNAEVTADWPSGPDPQPQSSLTGTFYECNPVTLPLIVVDAPSWLFAGTGAVNGEKLPGMLGAEFDSVNLAVPTPRPMEVLFHSPVRCSGRDYLADAAYYTAKSGADVFDSGTSAWICALLSGTCPAGRGDARSDHIITTVTTNLLLAFSAGPAGRVHPASDNLVSLRIPGAAAAPPSGTAGK